jgi:hypothetical protein
MYGTTNNNDDIKASTTTSYDAELGGENRIRSRNNSKVNNQSGYTRLVTFMIVVLSLLAVVTLSASAYVGGNSSSSVDASVTTTTTTTIESTIESIVPDNSGIIKTIVADSYTYNPTPTALYPTESPVEEIDLNKALNIVKEVKVKKETKIAQNKGKIIENSSS